MGIKQHEDISFIILAIAVYVIAGSFFTVWYNKSTEAILFNDIDTRLQLLAEGVEHTLNPEYHDRTFDHDSISPDEYRQVCAHLTAYAQKFGIQKIFALVKKEGQYFVTAENFPADNQITSRYWQPYDNHPIDITANNVVLSHYDLLDTGAAAYRTFLSPRQSAAGRDYLIGILYDISYTKTILQQKIVEAAILAFIFALIPLLLVVFYRKAYRRFSNQLEAEIMRHINEEESLRDSDAILRSVSMATRQFLSPGEWQRDIRQVLMQLGKATGMSRVHVFKNYRSDDGRLRLTHRYEWVDTGIKSMLSSTFFDGTTYSELGLSRWAKAMGDGELICGNTAEFPLEEQKVLTTFGVLSVITIPITTDEGWWGFLSFEDCRAQRSWSETEINALIAAASTLSAAIERKHSEESIKLNEARLETLLGLNQMDDASMEEIANFALAELIKLTKSSLGYIAFVQDGNHFQCLHLYYQGRIREYHLTGDSFRSQRGPWNSVLKTGQAQIDNEYIFSEAPVKWLPEIEENIKRQINIPLFDNGQIAAIAGVANKDTRYKDTDVNQLHLLIQGVLRLLQRNSSEEERNRLVTAVEQAAEAIIVTDCRGIIQFANPAFEHITGYRTEETLNRDIAFVLEDESDRKMFTANGDSADRQSWNGRTIQRKKDGSLFQVDNTISPVFDTAGNIVNFVSVQRDISHEIELETQLRQAQKMEAMGTLAGGIAHDFNNILSAILGYTELAMASMDEDCKNYSRLGEVIKAGVRASDLVKQILTFSRQTEHERKPMQLQPVVKEALKLLRGSLPTTIEIRQQIDTDCGTVLADPTRMHQIIMNLCTNAYHAMNETGGILEVKLSERHITEKEAAAHIDLKSGQYACLTVSDNGCGMDSHTIDRIFEPYFTTKKTGKGTGLGLATVHGIVKSHDGAISVQSEPGKGSTFCIYLPVSLSRNETAAAAKDDHELPMGSEHILFVDDEEALVEMENSILQHLGYRVTAHTSSLDALRAFETSPESFDLVITDQTMPRMTGFELAQRLMKIRPDIPVILCSGFTEYLTENQIKQAGIREYIPKPIITRNLAATIREVLQESPQ